MPESVSPEAWEKIQEEVLKWPARWSGDNLASFRLLSRETGEEFRPSSTACHAALSYSINDESAEKVILVNGVQATWHAKYPEFLTWLRDDAPFSHGVLNRDSTFLKNAAIYDLALIGQGGGLWMCKAARHIREEPSKVKNWKKLVDEGLTGFQAFIGADILSLSGEPYRGTTHGSLFGYVNPEDLRAFHDEILGVGKLKGSQVCRHKYYSHEEKKDFGGLTGRRVKKPDGWGGFIEVREPGDVTQYAKTLKEIFEGDPKNVCAK